MIQDGIQQTLLPVVGTVLLVAVVPFASYDPPHGFFRRRRGRRSTGTSFTGIWTSTIIVNFSSGGGRSSLFRRRTSSRCSHPDSENPMDLWWLWLWLDRCGEIDRRKESTSSGLISLRLLFLFLCISICATLLGWK